MKKIHYPKKGKTDQKKVTVGKPSAVHTVKDTTGKVILVGTIKEWRAHVRARKDPSDPFS